MQDILNRTSVRKFQTKKIEPEVLKQILQAGFSAPSAKNTQPWGIFNRAKSSNA